MPNFFQALAFALWAAVLEVVCRGLDLFALLFRPGLFVPYLAVWLAELRRSPYRWPRSFEAIRILNASGQKQVEAMYGEIPLASAAYLFFRAGLRRRGKLLDLGAGRGRALLGARWLGAAARGVELFPHHVEPVARAMARAGAQLEVGDAQTAQVGDATHVFLNWTGMSEKTQAAVTGRLLGARPGTRILTVSSPVASQRVKQLSRHWILFTWGLACVYVQVRLE